jgi:hypothetical protein
MLSGAKVKRVLGELPLTAELDWAIRGRRASMDGFKLDELKAALPEWYRQVKPFVNNNGKGKKVLVFATLHYWISHATLLSLVLAGKGHQATLAYLPYSNWKNSVSRFELRKREAYARSVFKPAQALIDIVSFSAVSESVQLPNAIEQAIEQVSIMDTQYTLQVEDVDKQSDLFQLRLQRNRAAAITAWEWMQRNRPDVVILPNGLILEFGAILQVARYLEIPVVSYEFGEQRDRIWLSHNVPVMLQETDEFWEMKETGAFSEHQRNQVEELFSARQSAGLFRNFYRRWQNSPAEGGNIVRSKLGLDSRPIVLLAANVIGDSLTLGRADFTGDMSTWLRRTLDYFAARKDVQFVLRIHPGERNLDGPSVADLVQKQLSKLPPHMHVIAAEDPINTYDLIAIADLGLVYTTTVGLELAMSGVPVIVAGKTHYRGKGFTTDPNSWDEYFSSIDRNLADITKLSSDQIDHAWHYAYRFFFDYPQPFPWHLLHFWKDVKATPLSYILSDDGLTKYELTFDYLLGEPFEWDPGQ